MTPDTMASGGIPPPANGRPTRWAAIAGRWRFDGSAANYLGPASAEDPLPRGLAVTNHNLTDGSVQVRIKFKPPDVSAGVVLGFHSEKSHYVIAQLGGYMRAYVSKPARNTKSACIKRGR